MFYSDLGHTLVPRILIPNKIVTILQSYCKDGGSTVYTCSHDAEGAFDAIPHCILFQKATGVLPYHCWHIMISCYSNLNVQV